MRSLLLLAAFILSSSAPFSSASADSKPDHLFFSGWLVEIDRPAHSFTVRSGKKLLQFTTMPSRTSITVGGMGERGTISAASLGDAVLGKVSLKESRPYLEWVEFTHRPASATPITGKPGFVRNPYVSTIQFDARKCSPGDMIYDSTTGKIFLIP